MSLHSGPSTPVCGPSPGNCPEVGQKPGGSLRSLMQNKARFKHCSGWNWEHCWQLFQSYDTSYHIGVYFFKAPAASSKRLHTKLRSLSFSSDFLTLMAAETSSRTRSECDFQAWRPEGKAAAPAIH